MFYSKKSIYKFGIKHGFSALKDDVHGFVMGEGRFIASLTNQSIIRVLADLNLPLMAE